MEDTPEEKAWREQCWREVEQWLAEERRDEARKARINRLARRAERERVAAGERRKAAEREEQQRLTEAAARAAAELEHAVRFPSLEARRQKEREELARLDAIWANELRLLEEDEAGPFRLQWALGREQQNQQNLQNLAAMEMHRLAASVMIDTPFSQMQLIPANAWMAVQG